MACALGGVWGTKRAQFVSPVVGPGRQRVLAGTRYPPAVQGWVGPAEVEGCDYDHRTGDLRVLVVPRIPLGQLLVAVYRYRRNRAG